MERAASDYGNSNKISPDRRTSEVTDIHSVTHFARVQRCVSFDFDHQVESQMTRNLGRSSVAFRCGSVAIRRGAPSITRPRREGDFGS